MSWGWCVSCCFVCPRLSPCCRHVHAGGLMQNRVVCPCCPFPPPLLYNIFVMASLTLYCVFILTPPPVCARPRGCRLRRRLSLSTWCLFSFFVRLVEVCFRLRLPCSFCVFCPARVRPGWLEKGVCCFVIAFQRELARCYSLNKVCRTWLHAGFIKLSVLASYRHHRCVYVRSMANKGIY